MLRKLLSRMVADAYRAARAARIMAIRTGLRMDAIEAAGAQEHAAHAFRVLADFDAMHTDQFKLYWAECVAQHLALAAASAGRANAFLYICEDEDFDAHADWAKRQD